METIFTVIIAVQTAYNCTIGAKNMLNDFFALIICYTFVPLHNSRPLMHQKDIIY